MLSFLVMTTFARPDPQEAAVLLLQREGGYVVASVRPLPDRKRWYLWEGTLDGRSCHGSVEVVRARRRKPRGRFSASCETPEAVSEPVDAAAPPAH